MKSRTILCFLKTNPHDHWEFQLKLDEMKQLAESMEYEVVDILIQQRVKKYSRSLIGKGKVEELRERIETYKINTVLFYNILTSKQNYNLTNELDCEVKDRYDLILDIFEQQSSDLISNLQITLAQMLKTFPKYKIEAHKKYRTEHPQFRSSGEYAYHSKIRAHDKRVAKIRAELDELKVKKLKQIASRKRGQFPFKTVCISGYYNAGKTTLFNTLTGENKPISDKPFTTLSSKYKHLKNSNSKIILIDTIGFVYDIDPILIKSFELQILDMREADKVLYLIGLGDELPNLIRKYKFGLNLLIDIGVDASKIIVVFNKRDLVTDPQILEILKEFESYVSKFPHIFISAKNSENLVALTDIL